MKRILAMAWLMAAVALSAQVSSNGPVMADYGKHITEGTPAEQRIAKEVRHELLMLPWYSLFDDLEFSVQGNTVTLSGYVTGEHAGTKSSAEKVTEQIEGVEKVVNNIEVLPPSPLDDRVREQTYRAMVAAGPLSKYFWEASPSIHIIVKNQRIILRGIVYSEGDKNLATITAKGIPGVFEVTNELRVVK
ncbi:MAG TPA: BON domain-containing protein [Candidatus Bathyarchaeia archaeon]|nr:BON domain-containing protein [Candidatus Bathyarchaeia archaeon]